MDIYKHYNFGKTCMITLNSIKLQKYQYNFVLRVTMNELIFFVFCQLFEV